MTQGDKAKRPAGISGSSPFFLNVSVQKVSSLGCKVKQDLPLTLQMDPPPDESLPGPTSTMCRAVPPLWTQPAPPLFPEKKHDSVYTRD